MAIIHSPAGIALPTFNIADQAAAIAGAANTSTTLTIAAPGSGLFIYLCHLRIARSATAALAGTASLTITTTNLPGTLAWVVGNAMVAGGTQTDMDQEFVHPLKASASNTAVTIVMPAAGAAVLWNAEAFYFAAA